MHVQLLHVPNRLFTVAKQVQKPLPLLVALQVLAHYKRDEGILHLPKKEPEVTREVLPGENLSEYQ